MEYTIWRWVAENYPMIFLILVACCIVAIVTWKIADWCNRAKNIEKSLQKKPDKVELPCDVHDGIVNNLKDNVKEVHTAIGIIQSDINDLKMYLMVKNPRRHLFFRVSAAQGS